jgi:hypothetical protein
MANVFTPLPQQRVPLVGDSRGDHSCPPDTDPIDGEAIIAALKDAGVGESDIEDNPECIVAGIVTFYYDDSDPANPGWAYRARMRYAQESGALDYWSDLDDIAALAAANL